MRQNDLTSQLSRREREIMDVLFELGGEASAEDIRGRLTNPPSYSAVRAMLAKLEVKKAVTHREDGARYLYTPTIERNSMQSKRPCGSSSSISSGSRIDLPMPSLT